MVTPLPVSIRLRVVCFFLTDFGELVTLDDGVDGAEVFGVGTALSLGLNFFFAI